jgi:transposase-like protein
MVRKKYTPEYKQEAVLLAHQSDIPVSQVARNLGINDNVLRRWIKEAADPGKKPFTGHGILRMAFESAQCAFTRQCPAVAEGSPAASGQ